MAKRKTAPRKKKADDLIGKRLRFDRETWNAIQVLARDVKRHWAKPARF